ncbi:MAG: phosphoribosylanthranilate isomerase [Candidatus Poribacteria bacterium]|nr:phosphoribosylanthranilate isomerase [Candidatus Poribacteria bacterium]
MATRVKICGITNRDDAHLAVDEGADALGFIFHPKSPRYITPEAAREIVLTLPPFVTTVGVFVDETPMAMNRVIEHVGLNAAQLHGDETSETCRHVRADVIKVFRVKDSLDFPFDRYPVRAFMLDTYVKEAHGGTGERFDWELAKEVKRFGSIILAGGLTPGNVVEAIRVAEPYAVDVSSGVEARPGVKNPDALRAFLRTVRSL